MTATAGNRSKTVFLHDIARKNYSSFRASGDIVFTTATALMFCSFHGCHHCRGNGVTILLPSGRNTPRG